MDLDRNGNIYLSGSFSDTTDFDPSSASYYIDARGVFIQKFVQGLPITPTITISANPGVTITAGQTDTFTTTTSGVGSSPAFQWYINGAPVSGATSSTFITNTLRDNDSVSCVVTSSDICSTSDAAGSNVLVIRVVSAVGGLQSLVGSLSVYPNPNGGEFFVEFGGATGGGVASVRVVDVLGREVYQGVLPGNGRGGVALGSEVADGVYLLQVVCEGSVVTTRVSVTK